MKSTHVKAHQRGANLNDPSLRRETLAKMNREQNKKNEFTNITEEDIDKRIKREDYPSYARRKSLENIQEASKYLSKSIPREKYILFMREAFVNYPGNYTSPDYANEWVERFNDGKEWSASDFERRHVLKEVFPEKYADRLVGDE